MIFGRYLVPGALFKNTMHFLFNLFYPRNLTSCCQGTFVMFDTFPIMKPFRQYILCIGWTLKLKQSSGRTEINPTSYLDMIWYDLAKFRKRGYSSCHYANKLKRHVAWVGLDLGLAGCALTSRFLVRSQSWGWNQSVISRLKRWINIW